MADLKKTHKELKRKVNLQEEVRKNDRSFTSWRDLKDLKKIKLALKDKLLYEKKGTFATSNKRVK